MARALLLPLRGLRCGVATSPHRRIAASTARTRRRAASLATTERHTAPAPVRLALIRDRSLSARAYKRRLSPTTIAIAIMSPVCARSMVALSDERLHAAGARAHAKSARGRKQIVAAARANSGAPPPLPPLPPPPPPPQARTPPTHDALRLFSLQRCLQRRAASARARSKCLSRKRGVREPASLRSASVS